ncbi:integrase core domain-containing protein, partial [Escherichia coli]|uniref:integrase core domain-containing protein n=1 Tax=Escherichia coli TaxID=562 RepID=UPI0011EA3FD3
LPRLIPPYSSAASEGVTSVSVMPKPDGLTAAKNLAEAFEHYNEWHPHSALGYRSPREYLRQQASNGLSDNRCLEI